MTRRRFAPISLRTEYNDAVATEDEEGLLSMLLLLHLQHRLALLVSDAPLAAGALPTSKALDGLFWFCTLRERGAGGRKLAQPLGVLQPQREH